MAGITLAQAEAQLSAYLAAETAVLTGQSYKIGERELTRADLEDIQAGIKIWNQRAKELATSPANGGRGRSVIPRPVF